MAKALGGGLPIGAVGLGPRVRDLPPGGHGSTFGGNPLACAAAVAAIRAIRDERLVERAVAAGARLLAGLRRIESGRIREVRGLGLMIGVELRERVRPTMQALQARGVLALQRRDQHAAPAAAAGDHRRADRLRVAGHRGGARVARSRRLQSARCLSRICAMHRSPRRRGTIRHHRNETEPRSRRGPPCRATHVG